MGSRLHVHRRSGEGRDLGVKEETDKKPTGKDRKESLREKTEVKVMRSGDSDEGKETERVREIEVRLGPGKKRGRRWRVGPQVRER